MKHYYLILILTLGCAWQGRAQNLHNDLPVLVSGKPKADYRVGNDWVKDIWRISPQANPDRLDVYFSKPVKFMFKTDKDSITFDIKDETPQRFYVLINDTSYALTEVKGAKITDVKFGKEQKLTESVLYENNPNSAFLTTLKEKYKLNDVIAGVKTDSAKALRMVHWVHQQWQHNGGNVPSKPDALTIMDEVRSGKRFRCTEYAIVTTAALNSIGLKSRVLSIFTQDCDTSASGGSHVVMEVYLKDMDKWVMLDGQYDVMPVLNNVPLNAVEFRNAIVHNYNKLEIRSLSFMNKPYYTNWVYPYLFYFEYDLDNREGNGPKQKFNGIQAVRLAPDGAKNPTVFQKQWGMRSAIFTHNVNEFYKRPDAG